MLIKSQVVHWSLTLSNCGKLKKKRESERARKRQSENEKESKLRRPMSRHRASHNTTDTNPGSVPLAPDCYKSEREAADRTRGEGQTRR